MSSSPPRLALRRPEASAPRLARVLLAIVLIKAYQLALLWAFAARTDVPEDYRAFLHLEEGESRGARLASIQKDLLERLAPYDGQYYLDIAERGYRTIGPDDPNLGSGPGGNYAFFPLYPGILRLLGTAQGGMRLAAAILLNVALSTLGALGVAALARRLGIPAWPAALLLLAYPASLYQGVLYTESLFLCISLASALLASSAARWAPWAGLVVGVLAGLTRPQGVLVGLLWLERAWRAWRAWRGSREEREREPRGSRALVLAAAVSPLLGVAVFASILSRSVGEPLGFLSVQGHWAREFRVMHLLGEALRPWAYEGPPLDQVAFWLGVLLVPVLWRRLPPSLALFGTGSLLLPLSTGTMLSLGRFLSVSFPHFLVLGAVLVGCGGLGGRGERGARSGSTRGFVAVLGVLVILQALLARGLVGWRFVG